MTYKDALSHMMLKLAYDSRVRFIGYNVACANRFNGTLDKVPMSKCIEMPVAENLIMGVAMGLSLEGFIPVVCIERMDFLLACADAIINHVDKLPTLSGKQFTFPMIIRTCVGHFMPLNPGAQHVQDHTELFYRATSNISIHKLVSNEEMASAFSIPKGPVLTVEYRSMYDEEGAPVPTVRSKVGSPPPSATTQVTSSNPEAGALLKRRKHGRTSKARRSVQV